MTGRDGGSAIYEMASRLIWAWMVNGAPNCPRGGLGATESVIELCLGRKPAPFTKFVKSAAPRRNRIARGMNASVRESSGNGNFSLLLNFGFEFQVPHPCALQGCGSALPSSHDSLRSAHPPRATRMTAWPLPRPNHAPVARISLDSPPAAGTYH